MHSLNREIWEGWTAQDFVKHLEPEIQCIMSGQSWKKPFQTKEELIAYIQDNQPYYKKPIPEVNQYFINRYF